jgi:CelD/BcsL family acetyltransferase involved in cellulose biosynthesis
MIGHFEAVVVRTFTELEGLAGVWDRLAQARPQPEVFHTFAWARSWWLAYGDQYEVFTPVIRRPDGEVAAIWPLVRRGRAIRSFGEGASDHCDLLAAPDVARPVLLSALEALAVNKREWTTGCLSNVSRRGVLVEAAMSLVRSGQVPMEIVQDGAGFTTLSEQGPGLFRRLAGKESLRRHRKKLERLGRVTFRHVEDPDEIGRHLTHFERQHTRRWALEGLRSPFGDPACHRYHEVLTRQLSSTAALRFGVLEVDGVPVAYHLGFEYFGKFIWYRPSFDVDFFQQGPGEVLLQSVLEYCASRGIRELDFTMGEEAYKKRFSNLEYGYCRLHLFSQPSVFRYILRVRERAKENRALYRAARFGRVQATAWLGRLRRSIHRRGIGGLASSGIRAAVRSLVFRRDEVIVFRQTPRGLGPPLPGPPDIEVMPARLSLLADLAAQQPGLFDGEAIRRFRQRLAAGERAWMALSRGTVVHVAWVSVQSAIIAQAETGPNCVLPLAREVAVVSNRWTLPERRGQGIGRTVLLSLIAAEAEAGREVWAYCRSGSCSTGDGILRAGFARVARMVRVIWFGRLEQNRVLLLDQG